MVAPTEGFTPVHRLNAVYALHSSYGSADGPLIASVCLQDVWGLFIAALFEVWFVVVSEQSGLAALLWGADVTFEVRAREASYSSGPQGLLPLRPEAALKCQVRRCVRRMRRGLRP